MITSLLSLSFGFMMWRKHVPELNLRSCSVHSFSWKDMVVDLIWNILVLSSRVLALALFAGSTLLGFLGLASVQVMVGFAYAYSEMEKNNRSSLFPLCFAVSSIFNLQAYYKVTISFKTYLLYWLVMFVENTVLILLWFHWSADRGLWYHEAVLIWVIWACFASFLVECAHMYFYADNSKTNDIFKWCWCVSNSEGAHPPASLEEGANHATPPDNSAEQCDEEAMVEFTCAHSDEEPV